MSKITIIEGNSDDKDKVRALMVKGEPGNDGVSPTIETSKTGSVSTVTFTDAEGTHTITVNDGEIQVSDIVDNLTTDNAQKPLSAKQGKVLNDKIIDSGWQSLTIEDTGFNSNSYVRYRKIGKLVEVQGQLQRRNSPITTSILIATLPGDYRPSKDLYQYGLGYTDGEKFEIRIGFSGEVRVRSMEPGGSTYGSEIINICMTYMID